MRAALLPFITFITLMAIAACAAFYSIYGLMLIFSGATIAIAIMAGSLEIGKLVIASIVFNYWKRMPILLTTYSVVAILGLMIITSGGIYGFLSSAYQQSQVPLQQISTKLELIDEELKQRQSRVDQLDEIIVSIGANYITKRMEEVEQQRPERERLVARIDLLTEQRLQLKGKQLDTEAHIGPIIKIAEAFNIERDKAVHYLILLFIVVFDPLAIALTLCLNVVLRSKREQRTMTPSDDTPPDRGNGDKNNSIEPSFDPVLLTEDRPELPLDDTIRPQSQIPTAIETPINHHYEVSELSTPTFNTIEVSGGESPQLDMIQPPPTSKINVLDDAVDLTYDQPIDDITIERTSKPTPKDPNVAETQLNRLFDDFRDEMQYLHNTFRRPDSKSLRDKLVNDITFADSKE